MRRVHLRGKNNIAKRALIHAAAFNLSLILRHMLMVQRLLPKSQDHLRPLQVSAANAHQTFRCVTIQFRKTGDVYLRFGGRAHGKGARSLAAPVKTSRALRIVMDDVQRASRMTTGEHLTLYVVQAERWVCVVMGGASHDPTGT